MVSFNLFWTSVALKLASAPLRLGHVGVGLFALAGAGSTIIAPVAGRLGDRGLDRQATITFHSIVVLASCIALLGGSSGLPPAASLALLVLAALLLDLGVIGDQAMGRRAVNLLNLQARGRVNGLFTGLFFFGGVTGALLAGPAWAFGHWMGVCMAAAAFALAANVPACRADGGADCARRARRLLVPSHALDIAPSHLRTNRSWMQPVLLSAIRP